MKLIKFLGALLSLLIVTFGFMWAGFAIGKESAEYPTQLDIKKMFNCKNVRDYQLELHMDTVWIYDGDRLVDWYISTWNSQLDTILMNDNQ